MSSPYILTDTQDGVTTITLARPERRNALDLAMYRAMADAVTAATYSPATRVVLFTGGAYFTAGNDLSDFVGYKKGGEFVALTFLKALAGCLKPVVAAVERGAIGVGATMLQHCDFVYAGRSTRFSLPFINFGLPAEGATTLILAQGAGARQATRWLMLGEPFTADEALSAGLLTEVLDDDTTLANAQLTAARLAEMSPEALRISKMLLRQARPALIQTLETEIDQFTTLLEGETAQAALRQFTQKARR